MASEASCQTSARESSRFHRSRSRVFYESDILSSTATSWEFRQDPRTPGGVEGEDRNPKSPSTPPMPVPQYSLVRTPVSEPNSEIRAGDGSRNSTGSSSGASHRSQDSGFSDSGENRRLGNRGQSQSPVGLKSKSLALSPLSSSHLHLSQVKVSPSPLSTRNESPVSIYVNGTPAYFHRSISTTTDCAHSPLTQCSSCIYQDVIVARALPGTISPLPEVTAGNSHLTGLELLGTPACTSTPKKFMLNHNRGGVMSKIDNFESLNKNMKSLDSNNNSSRGSENSGSSSRKPQQQRSSSSLVHKPSVVDLTPNQRASSQSPTPSSSLRHQSSRATIVAIDEEDARSSAPSPTLVNELTTYASQSKELNKSSPKWKTLPRGFKRVSSASQQDLIVKSHADNDSMRLWLHELRLHAEPECLAALQVKSISALVEAQSECLDPAQAESRLPPNRCNPSVSIPLISIRNVERVASIVSEEYARICKYLEFNDFRHVPTLTLNLLSQVEDFLCYLQDNFGNLPKLESALAKSCYDLRLSMIALGEEGTKRHSTACGVYQALDEIQFDFTSTTTDQMNGMSYSTNLPEEISGACGYGPSEREKRSIVMGDIVEGIVRLGNLFSQVVDQRLTQDLSSILDLIANGGLIGRVALQSFATILNEGGMHMCRLAANIRTVRGLLSALLDARSEDERVISLRCLATVLCIGDAVRDFDKAGGFEIIADILYEPCYGLQLKYEAVAVLTQVTDPWIDLETTLCSLGAHLEKIIVSLTHLIPCCQMDEDGFLLTVAAISNLTFLELTSIELLRAYGTIPRIISAVQRKSDFSIFIKDHVSTILANMAGVEICRAEIVRNDGIRLLLFFLQASPSPYGSPAEITACERLQQKSTIAISRLTNENGVADLILKLNGIQRLVYLSRNEKERNYSDGVLIACLATLRKLVSICGSELIKQLRAEELIEPRLLDSFLQFSSRQESYV